MNRGLKNTEFIRKEYINYKKKILNSEVFPKFLYKLMFGSVRASATFVSHHCPYSVATAGHTGPTETVAGGGRQ
jgi:hypothetical protein